jgi:hypothetical protein
MKHKILSLFIMTAAMSTVACSDDKPAQAGAQSCLTNPTLPGCSLQKAALAQVPGSPESKQAALAAPYAPPAGTGQIPTGPNGQPIVIPGVTPPATGTGIAVTSKSIQEHAARVAAALEADNNNPLSPNYIAPKVEAPERAPASTGTASVASVPVPVAPTAIDGSGEAIK